MTLIRLFVISTYDLWETQYILFLLAFAYYQGKKDIVFIDSL